jgi:hypothetical protein
LLDWEVVQEEIDNLANPALVSIFLEKSFFTRHCKALGRSTKSVKIVFSRKDFHFNLG